MSMMCPNHDTECTTSHSDTLFPFQFSLMCRLTCAAGDEIGMLEVVMNSDTVAHIQAECGGFRGALREDPMLLWLEKEHVRRRHRITRVASHQQYFKRHEFT